MLAGLAMAGSAAAQSPAPFSARLNSASQPLLSYPIEQSFTEYVRDCSGQIPLTIRRPGLLGPTRQVSAIDPRIIGRLNLTANPTILKDLEMSLGRVFGHVYNSRDVSAATFENRNFLRLTYEDRDKILQPGFPSTRLEASCISILAGALSANADFAFPTATLQAALEAESRTDSRSTMEVVRGRFNSPVWEMWDGSTIENFDRARHKFYAGILFWDWYSPGSGNRSLLEYFDGTVIYRQTRTETDQQTDAEASGRVNIPMFTAAASVDGELRQQSSYALEDFHVLIDTPRTGAPATTGWRAFPDLAAIVAAVENASPAELSAPDGPMIDPTQPKMLHADIQSLPAAYCNRSSWQVRDSRSATGPSSQLALASDPLQVRKDNRTVCRFQISYTPPASTTTGDVALTPFLASANEKSQRRLWLKLGDVTLTRNAGPELHRLSQQGPSVYPVNGSIPEASDIQWSMRFQLRNIGAYNDTDRIILDNLRLDCADVMTNAAEFAATFDGPLTGSSRTLVLTIRNRFQGALGTPFDTVQCPVTGEVGYRSPSGAMLWRRVENLTVNFPQPRPQQPMAAPAANRL